MLDKIRGTIIASKEAGGITQSIGTTEIPATALKKICGPLLEKFKLNITLPGLLFIDTPGHEAFTTLRRRGGSIADLVVLVVDIVEGIMPQTAESINILKEQKTPFLIAMNKIDRIQGWKADSNSFLENFESQSDFVKQNFEEAFYKVVAQFGDHSLSVERFDRISDFTKNIAAIPVSGKTGEGLPELFAILVGLAQQFLKNQLVKTDTSEGMVMEVKEVTGLGTTVDAIIYDGTITKNDYLVIAGNNFLITKIKALLTTDPLRDIRTEKKFHPVEQCHACCGIKISAPSLENVIAGSTIRTAKTIEDAKKIMSELEKEVSTIQVSTTSNGLILKADTIGSLEALVNIFKNHPIEDAKIGSVSKQDVMNCANNQDDYRYILAFNVYAPDEVKQIAKEHDVRIIESDIIYRILENYEKTKKENMEQVREKELDAVTRPGKITILPGCVFRASNPAIVGCEILAGVLKPGYGLFKDFKNLGDIRQIQMDGKNIKEAVAGDKVAVSISNIIIGKQAFENDILYTDISSDDYKKLRQHFDLLSPGEKALLEEIKNIKKSNDPRYGL